MFQTLRDAKRFVASEAERGVKRDAIVEVLLPKQRFDQVKKAEVPKALDWKMQGSGPGHEALRTMRLDNHLVFGRWAELGGLHDVGDVARHRDARQGSGARGGSLLSVRTPGGGETAGPRELRGSP